MWALVPWRPERLSSPPGAGVPCNRYSLGVGDCEPSGGSANALHQHNLQVYTFQNRMYFTKKTVWLGSRTEQPHLSASGSAPHTVSSSELDGAGLITY